MQSFLSSHVDFVDLIDLATGPAPTRLAQQIQFVLEIDKLKGVLRQTLLTDASRRENSAEHSWHLALMAIALAEYAPAPIDLSRVVQMLLLHDLVEIDAGDTFAFDIQANQDKAEREQAAADRLFGLLPPDLGQPLRACWEEFEAAETVDARFAHALDRFQPFLHNLQTEGGTWRLHGITCDRVLGRMQPVKQGAPALWPVVEALIHQAVAAGYLLPDPDTTPHSDRSYPDGSHPDGLHPD
ncbi:HD domain-containing protein [Thermoleptolyngbya oregonensis NK1-22]|uniref:HD domain-containing protein n=1 Tax=Thermoleptolyngbya oregonensis NK1-22 TaxID=2547457 RepID=A0AA96YKI5_9CYAN|nr:HD domain-containing protein [Thermoleptolyngbya oregonensis]WOB41947.1 HD domain-containing protein [Thermoleptolyngbya oregonensis NK1-22]